MTEANSLNQAALHLVVQGRVQGVGFRAFVKQICTAKGLTGWVRNRADDEVELIVEGEREMLESLVEILRTGPAAARVADSNLEWKPFSGNFQDFHIRASI